MRMHEDEVEIGVETVRALIRDELPQYADLAVNRLPTEGTTNAIFRIGGALTARFPLRDEPPAQVQNRLRQESRAAVELALCSPVATPTPVHLGQPGHGYPLPWAVQSWVYGTSATFADPANSVEFAQDLAVFITALREVDTRGRQFEGTGRGGNLRDHDDWISLCFQESHRLLEVSRLRRLWSRFRTLPESGPDVMSHTDLIPGNVLVSEGRLAGVIDGGGFSAADPALDLVAGWHLLDAEPRVTFRKQLACSGLEWERGMAWAFQQAMGLVWYYRESRPHMSALGRRTLSRIIDES